jgi:hypothetical protein
MTDEQLVSEGLDEINSRLRKMVAGEAEIYETGWNVWKKAFSLATKSEELMHPLWLIWGALTDWHELRPEEKNKSEEAMLRAASEWLNIYNTSNQHRRDYFQHWIYDELGYKQNPEEW